LQDIGRDKARNYSVTIDTWGVGADSVTSDDLSGLAGELRAAGAAAPQTSIEGVSGGARARFGLNSSRADPRDDPAEIAARATYMLLNACAKLGLPHNGVARLDIATAAYLEYIDSRPGTSEPPT
jgi:hypothetical protein